MQYYNSVDDLLDKLGGLDLLEISRAMKASLERVVAATKQLLLQAFEQIFSAQVSCVTDAAVADLDSEQGSEREPNHCGSHYKHAWEAYHSADLDTGYMQFVMMNDVYLQPEFWGESELYPALLCSGPLKDHLKHCRLSHSKRPLSRHSAPSKQLKTTKDPLRHSGV